MARKRHHVKQLNRNLAGPRGLVTSIIAQAVYDATAKGVPAHYRRSALSYFEGPEYQHHLGLLGLPRDLMPLGVERLRKAPAGNGNGRRRGAGERAMESGD